MKAMYNELTIDQTVEIQTITLMSQLQQRLRTDLEHFNYCLSFLRANVRRKPLRAMS